MKKIIKNHAGVNCILYCRVSSDEQKEGCSLDMQEKLLRAYCANQNFNVLQVYHEDHSAKSYMLNRPVLSSIYLFCKKNASSVDKVLFLRWDRFARNLEFALTFKRKFIDELGIEINAVESPIDFNGAEWSTLLGLYCGVAHTEDIKISKRTMDGIHGTLLKGKWTNRAPRGYKNVRRAKHDTEVVIDKSTAPRVIEAFSEVAKGVESLNSIRRRLFPNMGKTTFSEMLQNKFYIGLVHVPAYGDDPEQDVVGVHEPLIDKDIFSQVQNVIAGRQRNMPKLKTRKTHPDFFLRGFLTCPYCGHSITASHSTSRNGNKYGYYHCSNEQKHLRVRVDDVNRGFAQYVSCLKPNEAVLKLYEAILADVRSESDSDRRKEIEKLEGEITQIQHRLNRVRDLYIDGEILKEEKVQSEERYLHEIQTRQDKVDALNMTSRTGFKEKFNYAITLIDNLERYIVDAPIEVKIKLIGSMFPEKIEFDGKSFRTTTYNKVLDLIYQQTSELRNPRKEIEGKPFDLSSSVPGTGLH